MSEPKTEQQINSSQVGSVNIEYDPFMDATALRSTIKMFRAELESTKQQLTDLTACLEWADKNLWILQKFPKDGWHVAGHDLPMFPNLLSALKSAYENRDKTK